MPQLDKLTFIPQVFWLIILFLSLYIVVVEVLLPRINTIFQVRALKGLLHNVRTASLEQEKENNTVYTTLFSKLFENNTVYGNYLDRYNSLTAKSYGDEYYNALKNLRVNSAVKLENSYYSMKVKHNLVKDLLNKKI
jgi:hypothetical protein